MSHYSYWLAWCGCPRLPGPPYSTKRRLYHRNNQLHPGTVTVSQVKHILQMQTSRRLHPVCGVYLLIILVLILPGCAAPPRATDTTSKVPMLTSRDGHLRYPLPPGWLDATAHANAAQRVVWIVRRDYGASIQINTVAVDAQTREEVKKNGLLRLGQLSMQLNTNTRLAVVVQAPRLEKMNGREFCAYEIEEPATRDRLRVAVFAADERVYEVTALNTGPDPAHAGSDAFATLDRFLGLLRW